MRPALCAALLAVAPLALAGDRVDPGLLEFLGSVDSGGADWNDYLAGNDVDKVAKRARKAAERPKHRIATKPTKASKTRRLEAKSKRSQTKSLRQSKPHIDD